MRRLITHIEGLPPESAFVRCRRDADGWDQQSYLLADAVDELAALRYYVAVFLGAKPYTPSPVRRPGMDAVTAPEPAQARTAADVGRFLGGM